jgi:hypothetical protein
MDALLALHVICLQSHARDDHQGTQPLIGGSSWHSVFRTERRQIVALLPDREIPTVQAWLSDHPGIKIVCATVAAATARPWQKRCLTPSGSSIAGT